MTDQSLPQEDVAKVADLADRVEAAVGPDRELDRAIGVAVGRATDDGIVIAAGYVGVGAFTGSLDAAARLVPEGWGWLVSQPNAKAIASGLLKRDTPVMGEVQYGCDRRFAVGEALSLREKLPEKTECGNWQDNFPCRTCDASVPRQCPRFSQDHRRRPA